MDNEKAKDKIIEITTVLIEQYEGDIKKITSRLIAEKANIGLGSINYFFGSKENLITLCIQRIINMVTTSTTVNKEDEDESDRKYLTAKATYVFNFLFENVAVSRISIPGDLQDYSVNSNSVNTQKGFMKSLLKDAQEQDKAFLSFMLTATMQVAFLGSKVVKEISGYDLDPEERAKFIEKMVSVLFEDARKEQI